MADDVETLRKERSWLGPLVLELLAALIVGGALWFSELRSHGAAIDLLQRQVATLQSRLDAQSGMAADIAVIRERVDSLVKRQDLRDAQDTRPPEPRKRRGE